MTQGKHGQNAQQLATAENLTTLSILTENPLNRINQFYIESPLACNIVAFQRAILKF
jgi:hypothetical protein